MIKELLFNQEGRTKIALGDVKILKTLNKLMKVTMKKKKIISM
jgi:hypothetical protein